MRFLAAALATFGVLLTAACGNAAPESEAPQSPGEAVKRAGVKLAEAKSAAFSVTGTMRNKQYSRRALGFTLRGETQFGRSKGWIWLDLTDVYPAVIASHAAAGQREITRAFFEDEKNWRMELRIAGRDSWMRFPGLTDIFGGRPWIKSNARGRFGAAGFDDPLAYAWFDPGAMIPYLQAANQVKEVGGEDGLTRYHARVPLRRLVGQAPKKQRPALRRAMRKVVAQTGKRALSLDVWLDAGGVPRRFRVTEYEPKDAGERYPTTWRTTMDILEYGVDFDVLRPPARKVMTEQQFDRLAGN